MTNSLWPKRRILVVVTYGYRKVPSNTQPAAVWCVLMYCIVPTLRRKSDTAPQLLYHRTPVIAHGSLPSPPSSNNNALIMSHHPSTPTTLSHNFDNIFNRALDTYEKRTKQDLRSHPLYSRLEACGSPDAIRTTLREFSQSQNTDVRFTKWLVPTVNVLWVSSAILGEAVGLARTMMPPRWRPFF